MATNVTAARRRWALLITPLMVFYLVFFALPQLVFLRQGFYEYAGPGQIGDEVTTQTFKDVLSDSFVYEALMRTLALSSVVAVLVILIGFPLAYAATRWRGWGTVVFAVVVAAMFSSPIARLLGWKVLLRDDGLINDAFGLIGLGPFNMTSNFTAVTIGTVHAILPLVVIGLMPVCESLPAKLVEAAQGLGASQWRVVRGVIWPHVRVGVISMALLAFADVAGAFTTPAVLGGGKVPILPTLLYAEMRQFLDYPRAAVLAIVLFVIVNIVVLVSLMATRGHGAHDRRDVAV